MNSVNNAPFALETLPHDLRNSIPFELESLFTMQRVSKAWKKIAEEQMMTWHERHKQGCFSSFYLKNERMLRIVQQHGTKLRALRISYWNDIYSPQYVRLCTRINALYVGHLKAGQASCAVVQCVNFTALTALSIPNSVSPTITHSSLRKLCLVCDNTSAPLDTSLIQQSVSSLAKLKIYLFTLTRENSRSLLNLTTLTSLNLKTCKIDDPSYFLMILTTLTALRTLRVPEVSWHSENASAISTHLTSLRKLDLNVNVPGNYGIERIARSLTLLTSFTSMDFAQYSTSNEGVNAVFQNLTRLKELNLSRNMVADAVFQHLSRLSSLTSLSWEGAHLFRVETIGRLRFLKVLIIPRAEINSSNLDQLIFSVPPLKKLDITGFCLGRALINQLCLYHNSLEWLCAGNITTDDNDLSSLSSLLTNLTSLNICGYFSQKCIQETLETFRSKRREITIVTLKQTLRTMR